MHAWSMVIVVCRNVKAEQTNDLSAMYPYVSMWFWLIYSHFLLSHNSDNLVIGISNMGLNEESVQILSQMLSKRLKGVPILVLGPIFIETHRGPLLCGGYSQLWVNMCEKEFWDSNINQEVICKISIFQGITPITPKIVIFKVKLYFCRPTASTLLISWQ